MVRSLTPYALLFALLVSPVAPTSLAQRGDDIRSVDFRNFQYESGIPESGPVRVKDGEFVRTDEDNKLYFSVVDVVYGDVTGDGKEEALVQVLVNTGGTGNFSDGLLYTMRGGKPVEIASLGVGDRAHGGIHSVAIRDGKIVDERYDAGENGGACCPKFVEAHTIVWKDGKLQEVGKATRRAFYSWYEEETPAPRRVRFAKGTSAITLSGGTNNGEAYLVGARAGQTVRVEVTTKDAQAVTTISSPSRVALGTIRGAGSWSGTLPASGDFTVAVASKAGEDSTDAYYTIDLAIE